jgi:hypothetical protein
MNTVYAAVVLALSLVFESGGAIRLCAQGYQWQWDPRFPLDVPLQYLGVEAAVGVATHELQQRVVQPDVPCCSFNGGPAYSFRLGIVAEQWVLPNLAVAVHSRLLFMPIGFSAAGDTLPTVFGAPVVTEYAFAAQRWWVSLGVSSRYRVGRSPLSILGGLSANLSLATNSQQEERLVSGPAGYRFSNNSTSQSMEPALLNNAYAVEIQPVLGVVWDVPLKFGVVISCFASINPGVQSWVQGRAWHVNDYQIGSRLMWGL